MKWLNDLSRQFLSNGYLLEGVEPETRIREIAETAEKHLGIKGFADKFYHYVSEGYYSLSSPVMSNYGLERGLPISCFGSFIEDNMGSILDTHSEVGTMTKLGGGTSGFFGELRPAGSEIKNSGDSSGSVHFMRMYDNLIDVVSQGSVRRGMFAGYLPIEHDDIDEFLNIGNQGSPIQLMYTGVTVTDKWLQEMVDGDSDKRATWAKVLKSRKEIGYPYVIFIDNANDGRPDVYKNEEKYIKASNLCSEIFLPSDENESFVCVLASMNLATYDKWKDTDAVETMIYFLDTIVTESINKLKAFGESDDSGDVAMFNHMQRAIRFMENHRALGCGVLGFHTYLQKNLIPMDSAEAAKLNVEMFKLIQSKSYKASEELAEMFDEPELLKGYGRRNTTLNAIAPTKSSAFIFGQVSPSIEPYHSNYYVTTLAKAEVVIKNPQLVELLECKGENTPEVWNQIADDNGSVQNIDCLSKNEKEVFKTFEEIRPVVLIDLAGTRQPFIDQGQSLNLKINDQISSKDLNAIHLHAWKMGVKSLYYQKGTSAAQNFSRECLGCSA